MNGIVNERLNELRRLCEQFNVKSMYAFGSVCTEKFNENSDIDILVQFSEVDIYQYFDNYMNLKEQMESLLKRKIDIVENQAIRNPIFRQIIDREKQLLYERKNT